MADYRIPRDTPMSLKTSLPTNQSAEKPQCFSGPTHIPVLLEEVVEGLRVEPEGRYIDCTVGSGGHAVAILERSSPGGQLLGIDVDPEAIRVAEVKLESYGAASLLVNDNFINLEEVCSRYNFRPVQGILFDLGISSLQLDSEQRGFSFRFDAPLDMRFNPDQENTAADFINNLPEAKLAALIKKYGEERRSREIARRIVEGRPINTTLKLSKVVAQAMGGVRGRINPATKTFQALRIAVNRELENLSVGLKQAVKLLGFGGRLAVISYHSLEDRPVKEFLRQESMGYSPTLRLVSKKVIKPSPNEVRLNPRSRSAKLRVAERI